VYFLLRLAAFLGAIIVSVVGWLLGVLIKDPGPPPNR
jgi:hypothetical protein